MDVCYGLSCVLPKAQVLPLVPSVTTFGDRGICLPARKRGLIRNQPCWSLSLPGPSLWENGCVLLKSRSVVFCYPSPSRLIQLLFLTLGHGFIFFLAVLWPRMLDQSVSCPLLERQFLDISPFSWWKGPVLKCATVRVLLCVSECNQRSRTSRKYISTCTYM